ncbi:TniB family NTP-binding protein [Thioclava electrotropha]|uniref:AAA family ATPase n=1 Tax=Thioclava electrotropha TaxID=1549850 RepID=A0ABX6YVT9_9RHOB|nr:TniB family NTP-binding protein [Thioclava electrotropha]QPZ91773.1 AAA family ATPase [Thioclava electrotropha]
MNDIGKVMRILEDLRGLHVTNPRDAEFASQLQRLLAHDADGNPLPSALRFTSTGETRGIMIIDEPGGGKSTLVQRGLDRCAALQAEPGAPKRYLDAAVPSPATLKSMTRELLKDSGYPDVSKSREVWSMMELLRERISMLGVVAIWIDEAHDLFCADRNLILRALKSLMQGDAAVIVILSGTSALAEVVRSDPQVQRRFTSLILPPVDPKTDGDQIAGLIESYCQRAGLAPPAETDLVARVTHAARYRFGRTVEVVVNAIERALMDGADRLDMDHFAEAYALHEGAASERNVFLVEDWWNLRPDGEAEEAPSPRRRRKGRG